MPKKQYNTIKGQYCAPRTDGSMVKGMESCYTKTQLVNIAKTYNKGRVAMDTIITSGKNKEELWEEIDSKMRDSCKDGKCKPCENEWCWLDQLNMEDTDESFLPKGPKEQFQWLSTDGIRQALKVYERSHKDFAFLGPVPMDFCSLTQNEVCNINIERSLKNGKTKIGIVFNTDPSTESGQHWISMFIDMSNKDRNKWEINYFDSYGLAPLTPEVKHLISKLQEQNNNNFNLQLNCKDDICTIAKRHQMGNSECGVYSINFIVERLTGRSWYDIIQNPESDANINMKRKKFFRPSGRETRDW